MDGYAGLGIMFVLAFAFPVFPLIVAPLLQPRQPTREKRIPYECGVDTIGKTQVRFHIGYFMYALVFLLFDVETVFLYPWAVKYSVKCWYLWAFWLLAFGMPGRREP